MEGNDLGPWPALPYMSPEELCQQNYLTPSQHAFSATGYSPIYPLLPQGPPFDNADETEEIDDEDDQDDQDREEGGSGQEG